VNEIKVRSVGGKVLIGETGSYASITCTQTAHGLHRTLAYSLSGRQLTVWAMARHHLCSDTKLDSTATSIKQSCKL